MGKPKFSTDRLLKLLKEGHSQSQCARILKVSAAAISQRLREVRGQQTRVVAAKKIERAVDEQLDAMGQLRKINTDAVELLDLLMSWNRGEPEALQVLEGQVKRFKVGEDEEIETSMIKMKDPRQLALSCMAEIRGQLKLQLEIFQTMFDVRAVEEFQSTVLEVIGEVDDATKNEILRRLNAKRVARQAVRFD
nr:hypothetical protein 11 [Desulfobacteraceae bacterium]